MAYATYEIVVGISFFLRLSTHPWASFSFHSESSYSSRCALFIYLFVFFVFFVVVVVVAISWAAPAAYGGSQARGPIGAVATGLRQSHSNAGSEPRLQPTPQLTATPDR